MLQKTGLIAFFAFICLAQAVPAQAEQKWFGLAWPERHWEYLGNFQPFIDHPTQTHNRQWDKEPWAPSDWAAQNPDGALGVIDGFKRADIVRRFYVYRDTPAVEVGPNFYNLGGKDKQHVAAMIDEVYGITRNDIYGIYTLYDWNSHKPIGMYSQHGLQLK